MGRGVHTLGLMAVMAASATLVLGAATAQPAVDGAFFVGFSEDMPRAIGPDAVTPARDLGAGAFRFTLQWPPGKTRVSDTDVADLAQAVADTSGMKVVYASGCTNDSDCDVSGAQRCRERPMCRAGSQQNRARRIDAVSSRERER
jgi:hypothetical protein